MRIVVLKPNPAEPCRIFAKFGQTARYILISNQVCETGCMPLITSKLNVENRPAMCSTSGFALQHPRSYTLIIYVTPPWHSILWPEPLNANIAG